MDFIKLEKIDILKKIIEEIKLDKLSLEKIECILLTNKDLKNICSEVFDNIKYDVELEKELLKELEIEESIKNFLNKYLLIEEKNIKKINSEKIAMQYYSEKTSKNADSLKDYFKMIENSKFLSKENEKELFKKYHSGDLTAKNVIIESNLKFVVSIAKKYSNSGIELLDLIQEGNIGLIEAIDKFDLEKGNRFLTYAAWKIRQKIVRAIQDHSRTIRIPANKHADLIKLSLRKNKLREKLGRDLDDSELAEILNIKEEEIIKVKSCFKDFISLSTPIGERRHGFIPMLEDYIKDDKCNIEEEILEYSLSSDFEKAFEILSEQEKKVIKLRYGFVDGEPKTLEEIGKKYDCTREWIRKIEAKALRKLRNPNRTKYIKDYLEK